MIDAIVQSGSEDTPELEVVPAPKPKQIGDGKRVILIDHEDSFVHTLGNYLRQTGAEVQTLRSGKTALSSLEKMIRDGNKPDMVSSSSSAIMAYSCAYYFVTHNCKCNHNFFF